MLVTKMLQLNDQAIDELHKIDQWDFDIFKLRKTTQNNELVTILPYILSKRGLLGVTALDFNKLMNFIRVIQNGYKKITYHNKTHGADLCQTFNYFMTTGEVRDTIKLDNIECISSYIAACCHDYEHPGVNNVFLVNIHDLIAVRHNDQSVLESHHIAASFELMHRDTENNWAVKFKPAEYKRIRKVMITTVLATDMSKHFPDLGLLKSRMSSDEFDPESEKDKEKLHNLMFHLADISNPTKNWGLCRKWTDLLYFEFFAQGDLEKQNNFPVSQFMDR